MKTFLTQKAALLVAFCAILLNTQLFAQVTATEDFENETTPNSTTPHTFSESGIGFNSTFTFQKTPPLFALNGYGGSPNYKSMLARQCCNTQCAWHFTTQLILIASLELLMKA